MRGIATKQAALLRPRGAAVVRRAGGWACQRPAITSQSGDPDRIRVPRRDPRTSAELFGRPLAPSQFPADRIGLNRPRTVPVNSWTKG